MKIVYSICILLFVYGLTQYIVLRNRIAVGNELAQKSIAYSQHPQQPTQYILIVGDSTAVGTGASEPIHSIAGRLGADYPNADIVNMAVNGAKIQDVKAVLSEYTGPRVDLLLIHMGGNNIVQFTALDTVEEDMLAVFTRAHDIADDVVVVTSGNVGTAKVLPLGIRWVWGVRTRQVRELFLQHTKEQGIHYVDLYTKPSDDPFSRDAKKYYAADMFHPSNEGYALWYTQIIAVIRSLPNGKL